VVAPVLSGTVPEALSYSELGLEDDREVLTVDTDGEDLRAAAPNPSATAATVPTTASAADGDVVATIAPTSTHTTPLAGVDVAGDAATREDNSAVTIEVMVF
jgi:hypothetical protein